MQIHNNDKRFILYKFLLLFKNLLMQTCWAELKMIVEKISLFDESSSTAQHHWSISTYRMYNHTNGSSSYLEFEVTVDSV